MVKIAPLYLTPLLLAPCLSAQTTASSAAKAFPFPSYSSSSSENESTSSSSAPVSAARDQQMPTASAAELWAQSYCLGHPGEDWTRISQSTTQTGHCPSADDRSIAVLNNFLAHHKKIAPSPANTQTLVAYVSYNKLNPRENKSYERAYKSLKNAGELDLYK